ncbi:MAG: helix-turn-helix domain-containing protein [Actinobacteria bacterium]|nr:helix-turn-helix domain-containing protein [Actinomycetota bacterium]
MSRRRKRLAERRKTAGYSQEQLAAALDVERSTVVRWEAGDTAPQPWFRPKLARLLDVSGADLEELLGGTDAATELALGSAGSRRTRHTSNGCAVA